MSICSRMWEKHEVNLSPVVRGALSLVVAARGVRRGRLLRSQPATQPRAGPGSWPRGQLIGA